MTAAEAGLTPGPATFRDLGLGEPLLRALAEVGYESPSPIQSATIPALLSGADLLGQAQTGTGKTAAFALPALERLDLSGREPQVLVLVPTRELALQVAEAFQRYASHLKGFHVLPIYGGQSYQPQLNALRRGVHVVVGTPGRVSDHLERGTLTLASIKLLVLDEADEMLRMGFLEAVEAILVKTPPHRQAALFSATLPAPIRRIAQRHLRSPVEVTIQSKAGTAPNVRQRYWLVSGLHKLDALTRILETEPFDGMLVFTRTKQATVELAEKLEARGFSAAPLNGDIPQPQRERTVARLKAGDVDIVVATDVAARGLDVDRVGHVINYDAPYDPESYVHRIGRTGRAGRKGEAILFIAPRERNLLRGIEHATRQRIEPMNLPTVDAVNSTRIAKFKARIIEAAAQPESRRYRPILEQLEAETDLAPIEIAAALASLAQSATPLLLGGGAAEAARPDTRRPDSRRSEPQPPDAPRPEASRSAPSRPAPSGSEASGEGAPHRDAPRPEVPGREAPRVEPPRVEPPRVEFPRAPHPRDEVPRRAGRADRTGRTETFRIEVGSLHEIKAGNIVGAIANEAGLDGAYIGRVDIREDHSFVDLPEGMPREIFKTLKKTRLAGRELRITKVRRPDEGRPPPAKAIQAARSADRGAPKHRPAKH
jgi:ATP-dependent RNA helicase DeaD